MNDQLLVFISATGRSGWRIFINLIPSIGSIILLVFLVEDGKPGDNQ